MSGFNSRHHSVLFITLLKILLQTDKHFTAYYTYLPTLKVSLTISVRSGRLFQVIKVILVFFFNVLIIQFNLSILNVSNYCFIIWLYASKFKNSSDTPKYLKIYLRCSVSMSLKIMHRLLYNIIQIGTYKDENLEF